MDSDHEHGMDRRAFLRRAAVSGAAAAWAVPLVRTVAATPAYAQANGSPPPRGGDGSDVTKPTTTTTTPPTTTTTATTTPAGQVVTNPGVTTPTTLPQNIPVSGGVPAQVLGETLTRGSGPSLIGGGALGAGAGLAFTGSPIAALVGLGAGFLAAGGVMRIVARFRSAEPDA